MPAEPIESHPPLGLKPERIWRRERRIEIAEAVMRYVQADKPIPHEWLDELERLSGEA